MEKIVTSFKMNNPNKIDGEITESMKQNVENYQGKSENAMKYNIGNRPRHNEGIINKHEVYVEEIESVHYDMIDNRGPIQNLKEVIDDPNVMNVNSTIVENSDSRPPIMVNVDERICMFDEGICLSNKIENCEENACASDNNEGIIDDIPDFEKHLLLVNMEQDYTNDSIFKPLNKIDFIKNATEEDIIEIESLEPEELLSSLNNLSMTHADETSIDEEIEVYTESETWLKKDKHIFILTGSGKPVYSRYGKENKLANLFGLIQALVSVVEDGDDTIRSVTAGSHTFVFVMKCPLTMLAVSQSTTSVPQLALQLSYIHDQISVITTGSTLTNLFNKRQNFDFRRVLVGTERLLDMILNSFDVDPSYNLAAVQCFPLNISLRDTITQTIMQYCSKIKDIVYIFLISKRRLITMMRMKNSHLHPADLHVLVNLIEATPSLRSCENWMPICLPHFNSNGYLYSYVSYLSEDCDACLLLMTIDREQFFVLSEAKQKIVDKLRRLHCLEKLTKVISAPFYDIQAIGCPELRHFIYKSKSIAQFTCPIYTAPYNTLERQKYLYGLYQMLHHRIHSVARPLKMIYQVTSTETLVGWVTKEFELYATLEPLISRANSITAVNKLLQWIKAEENKLFILISPTLNSR